MDEFIVDELIQTPHRVPQDEEQPAASVLKRPVERHVPQFLMTKTFQRNATNAAVAITLDGIPNCFYQIAALFVSYSAAPTGGNILVQFDAGGSNNNERGLDQDILDGGMERVITSPTPGLCEGLAGQSLTVTLAAGGAGIIGKLMLIVGIYRP